MRVAVTGAGGLIGRHVVNDLRSRGHQVLEIVRNAGDGAAEEVVADLSRSPLPPAVTSWSPDSIVHLAAIPSPGVVADDELFVNNAVSTSNVLFMALQAGVKRVVIASSISVYGYVWSGETRPRLPSVPISEESPIYPSDGYALTKEVDEATARMYARRYEMSIAILRFPNVSSRDDAMSRRRAVMLDQTIASRELWAYLTFEQANDAIADALTADFSGAVTANIVSPQSLFPGDVRPLVERFFPEAQNDLVAGTEQSAYTSDVAHRVFGFSPDPVLESVDTSR